MIKQSLTLIESFELNMVIIVKQFKNSYILNSFFVIAILVPSLVQADKLILDPLIRLDNYYDPEIIVSGVEPVFPESLKPLWLKALKRPEADYQRLAATTITLAHRRGMDGLEETIPDLVGLLNQTDLHPIVKLAVIEALIELDARDQAGKFAEIAQSEGVNFQNKIEPALADWNYGPYRKIWLERINGEEYSRRAYLLGLKCLIEVKEGSVFDRLLELSKNQTVPAQVRIASADGLGELKKSGLIEEADSIYQEGGFVNEFVAVNLIKNHEGEKCIDAMQKYGLSDHPAVAKVALSYLLNIEDIPLGQIAEKALQSREPALRKLGVKAYERFTSANKKDQLLKLFADPSYIVRRAAREVLEKYSENEDFKDSIVKTCRELIQSENWHEVEQAIILLVILEDNQVAHKMLDLLKHSRPEIAVTSAWALRKFSVLTSLEGIGEELLRLANQKSGDLEKFTPVQARARELKSAQLILIIGELKLPFPQDQLKLLITSKVLGDESRVAAIWTLGMLNEGEKSDDVERKLIARVTDTQGEDPEDVRVRRMSAVALGHMKSKRAIFSLKEYYRNGQPSFSTADRACGWALEQITGEKMVPVKDLKQEWDDWFLRPIRK